MNIKAWTGRETIYSSLLSIIITALTGLISHAQELPLGYIPYYNESGSNSSFLSSLARSIPDGFALGADKSYTVISAARPDSGAIYNLPLNRGIIPNKIFGDFILELEFRISMIPDSGLSGFCFLGPVQSCDSYYVLLFSNDSVIFYYTDRGKQQKVRAQSLNLKVNQWHKIRISRNILNRSLTISEPGKKTVPINFSDRNLVMGYIGFGSENVNSHIRNIRIWSQTAISEPLYHCR
jgi:hypothetical protein